jgi:hypothetical protein
MMTIIEAKTIATIAVTYATSFRIMTQAQYRTVNLSIKPCSSSSPVRYDNTTPRIRCSGKKSRPPISQLGRWRVSPCFATSDNVLVIA